MGTATAVARDGLRERKKRETFRALQSEARRLVTERGLDNVTVEEIATAANVSKRTFFNYFDSKEAAIVDAEPDTTIRLREALDARPADETPLQALRAAAMQMLHRQARGLQELTALVATNPGLAERQINAFTEFQRLIEQWAAERTGTDPATSVYPALLGSLTGVVTHLTVARWRPETGDTGFTELADEIFDLLASGLVAPQPVPARRSAPGPGATVSGPAPAATGR